MCDRYILVTTGSAIETKFGLPTQPIVFEPDYNISPGKYFPVITNDKPHEIQLFKFGLTPFWAGSEMNLYTARAEGDANKTDNPAFRGASGIIQKKAFRKPIRSQRCLVIASAFVVGTSNKALSNPYLVYLRNHQNPFAFAGIWDCWYNPVLHETVNSFSIITTSANNLIQQTGSSRMPVILSDNESKKWIHSETELSRITAMLNQYDSKLMNAYPISSRIINPDENDKLLLQPQGKKLLTEENTGVLPKLETRGHSQPKKRPISNEPKPTMAEKTEAGKVKENQAKQNLNL